MSGPVKMDGANGHTVEAWWDRERRCWVIQTKDRNGDQVGEADYAYSRDGAMIHVGYALRDLQSPAIAS